MPETEIEIAKKSLSFLKTYTANEEISYPASKLPYPKDVMKNILLKYATHPETAQQEKDIAHKFYIFLAYFIDDKESDFVNTMSEKIADAPQVPPGDTKITAEWFKNLRQTDDYKKYTIIYDKITSDRNKLRAELESIKL